MRAPTRGASVVHRAPYAGWTRALPDGRLHGLHGVSGVDAHLIGGLSVGFFGLGALLGIWAILTRGHVAIRADDRGIRDRSRIAPERHFAWAEIARVTTRQVGPRTLVSVRLGSGRVCDLGWHTGTPEAVAGVLEEARLRRSGAPG